MTTPPSSFAILVVKDWNPPALGEIEGFVGCQIGPDLPKVNRAIANIVFDAIVLAVRNPHTVMSLINKLQDYWGKIVVIPSLEYEWSMFGKEVVLQSKNLPATLVQIANDQPGRKATHPPQMSMGH